MSCHFLIVGSAIISGLPALISAMTPMPSEWSVITAQSSGRAELHRLAAGGDDFLPSREAQSLFGPEVVPNRRVCRPRRVQVLVAKVRPFRIAPPA